MPDSGANTGSLIGAAGAVAGAGINAVSVGKANKRSIEYAREAYAKQRADSIEFWNMQNAYNDPSAQMARFKAAGLNPNLIYGQGNSGNAAAPDVPQFRPPEVRPHEFGSGLQAGALSYMNSVYDLRIKAAQAKNLEAQNAVIIQDAVLRAAQIGSVQQATRRSVFDLDFESELRPVSADARKEQLRQLVTGIQIAQDSNARAAVQQATSIQEAGERIKTMQLGRQYTIQDMQRIKATVTNLQKDGTLKDLDINLRKLGIQPGSPLWSTVAGQVFSRILDDPMGSGVDAAKQIIESIKGAVSNFQMPSLNSISPSTTH
ncbi:MAG: DNA pilot protein [Microvirus sp.]|nr:MAG: DNA pilot protein [Microvirus sp.]